MARCPWCSEELPAEEAGARFCPFCGSDMTQAPPQAEASEPPPVFTHTGTRFVLGHGPDFYAIWDRTSPGEPVRRFPRTNDGWTDAWRAFSSWEPAAERVGLVAGALPSAPDIRPMAPLSRALVVLLTIIVVVSVVAVISDLLELGILGRIESGSPVTIEEAGASDSRQAVIGLVQVSLLLATGIVWLIWQFRGHRNLRGRQVGELRFTPGWAVGWWFVPIANLWKPYQTMAELWEASDPAGRRYSPTWPGLPWWWIGFLASNILSQIAIRLYLRENEVSDLILSSRMILASDAVDIPTAILAILLVRGIARRQAAWTGEATVVR